MTSQEVEKTEPGIFHIHIDAQHMSIELHTRVTSELRFKDSNFDSAPEGQKSFAPQQHMTLKLKDKKAFFETWAKLEEIVDESGMIGYMEGEYLPTDEFISYKPYQDTPLPFKIERRQLSDEEQFRQTEFHLAMDMNESDPRLVKRLMDSGLMAVCITKKRGQFVIFTAQGYIKDIEPLYALTKRYLETQGGAAKCTIKEERSIRFKLFGTSSDELPEIVDKIHLA